MDPTYVGALLDGRYRAITRSGKRPRTPPGQKRRASAKGSSASGKKHKKKDTYEVSRIIASRTRSRRKKPEYLTQWKHHTSPKSFTWQTDANLRGAKADGDRKLLLGFVAMKKKLAERIDAMNNPQEVEGLVSEYDKLFSFDMKKNRDKITLHVTPKDTKKKHTFHATRHANYVVLDTPEFWSREYLFARAKLALKMGEGMPIRESTKSFDAMGECTYKDCLKDLVGVSRTLPRGI